MNTKIKPDSLEIFMRRMESFRRMPMNEEKARFFKSMLISSEEGRDVEYLFTDLFIDSPTLVMINKRIKALLTIDIELEVQLFIFLQSDANIGKMILYVYYLQYWAFRNNLKSVDMKTFSCRIFPDGFPSNNDLDRLWGFQKMNDDTNLIDYPEASASFQYC